MESHISNSTVPEEITLSQQEMTDFLNKFQSGVWYSIDQFLERHPNYKEAGKYFISHELCVWEKRNEIFTKLGWYENIRHAVAANTLEEFVESNLSIVTFNYDRSIDMVLHEYLVHAFDLEHLKAWEVLKESIPIIHMHGTLGDYPNYGYNNEDVLERSKHIKVVSEYDGALPDHFQRASLLLNSADQVVVFGFGFGEENVKRLNFFKEQEEETRNIYVSMGQEHRKVLVKQREEKLSRWGLKQGKHYWNRDCDDFLQDVLNPFL